MKVRFTGISHQGCLTNGKVYVVIAEEDGFYRLVDDDDDGDYLYHKSGFEIVNE